MKKKIKNLLNYIRKERKIPILNRISNNEILNGKIAFITGGSGGIGSAIAEKFVSAGCKVIIAGTNKFKLEELCKKIGKNSRYIILNLNDIDSFEYILNESVNFFGKIDILVNCAGMHTNRNGLDFLNITKLEYDEIMNLNLKSVFFISQTFSKYFIDNSIHGHILMISSQSALEPSWSPYRLSKRGLNGITVGLAQKLLKYDIIVNGIAPGPTATAMQEYKDGDEIGTDLNPINRYTMPSEIAEYAVLLVSDLGNTIIGDTIYMSGGRGIIDLR